MLPSESIEIYSGEYMKYYLELQQTNACLPPYRGCPSSTPASFFTEKGKASAARASGFAPKTWESDHCKTCNWRLRKNITGWLKQNSPLSAYGLGAAHSYRWCNCCCRNKNKESGGGSARCSHSRGRLLSLCCPVKSSYVSDVSRRPCWLALDILLLHCSYTNLIRVDSLKETWDDWLICCFLWA